MDYNPYFRYESSNLNLRTGMRAPVYPVQMGLSTHTNATQKLSYTTTERRHGTEDIRYTIKGMKKDDMDIVEDFWTTTLSEGYYDFTVIDNRARMLFEASWNDWQLQFSKKHGGVYNVIADIESSVPWTLPVLGAYLMTGANLNNHTLQGDNLSLDDGLFTDYSLDTNILRRNGYALKLTGNGTSSKLVGAVSDVTRFGSNIDGSLSIFCQYRGTTIDSTNVNLVEITNDSGDGLETIRYSVFAGNNIFGGEVNGNTVGTGAGTFLPSTFGTWYDGAITYDAQNDNIYVYSIESPTTTFVNFLYNASALTDQIGSYMGTPTTPSATGYRRIKLLSDDGTGGVANGVDAYLQNVFIFDGHLTPMEFNKLRRLCYLWNNKTTEYPK